jgi:hypothetical protein
VAWKKFVEEQNRIPRRPDEEFAMGAKTRKTVAKPAVGTHAAPNSTPPERVAPPAQTNIAEEHIRMHAYFKWVAAGMPAGDGIDFWLEAERELNSK